MKISSVGSILLGLAGLFLIADPVKFNYLFIFLCLYLLIVNIRVVNIAGILLTILVFRVIQDLLLELGDLRNNYIIYSWYIVTDLAVIVFISTRVMWSRYLEEKLFGKYDKERYVITNANQYISFIYFVYILVSFLALIEHALRHLEHFGFDLDDPITVYLYENARYIFYSFPMVKHILNALEFVAVLATVTNYMKSQKVLTV